MAFQEIQQVRRAKNGPPRRFRSLIFAIDLLGLVGAIAMIAGYWPNARLLTWAASFLQDAGLQLVGTWLSVRVIELIIRRQDDFENARTRLLRHARWWSGMLREIRYSISQTAIERLRHELKYTMYMKQIWEKFLTNSEISTFSEMVLKLQDIENLAILIQDIQSNLDRRHSDFENRVQRDLLLHAATKADFHAKPDTRPAIAMSILKQQLRLANSEIFDVEACRAEAQANWDAATSSLGDSLNTWVLDREFLDGTSDCLGYKAELAELVRSYGELLANLEIDVREETPERWV